MPKADDLFGETDSEEDPLFGGGDKKEEPVATAAPQKKVILFQFTRNTRLMFMIMC